MTILSSGWKSPRRLASVMVFELSLVDGDRVNPIRGIQPAMTDKDRESSQFTVLSCPRCTSSQIYPRSTKQPKYRCADCDNEFCRPVERDYREIG